MVEGGVAIAAGGALLLTAATALAAGDDLNRAWDKGVNAGGRLISGAVDKAQSLWTKIKLLIAVGGTQGKIKRLMDEIERVRKEQLVIKKEKEKEGGESGPDPKKDPEKKP